MDTMGAQLRIFQNQTLHDVDLLPVRGCGSGTDVSRLFCAGYFMEVGYVKRLKLGILENDSRNMEHGGWLRRFEQFV
jgi:hypothetical protein